MKSLVFILSLFTVFSAEALEETIQFKNGSTMNYFIELPAVTNGAPLCVVMGGGTGDRKMATATMKKLGKKLAERGMIVVSPISPNGRSFYTYPETSMVLALIKQIQSRKSVANGKVLMGGTSNGGISSLAIAAQSPSTFRGIMMVPGLPLNWKAGVDLKGLPVYLRIGAKDKLKWGDFYLRGVQDIKAANAKLDAKLLPEAGHGIPIDWDDVDRWLKTL